MNINLKINTKDLLNVVSKEDLERELYRRNNPHIHFIDSKPYDFRLNLPLQITVEVESEDNK